MILFDCPPRIEGCYQCWQFCCFCICLYWISFSEVFVGILEDHFLQFVGCNQYSISNGFVLVIIVTERNFSHFGEFLFDLLHFGLLLQKRFKQLFCFSEWNFLWSVFLRGELVVEYQILSREQVSLFLIADIHFNNLV